MPRIRCNYEGCIHLEGTLCTAPEIEFDQELGCLTFSQVDEEVEAIVDGEVEAIVEAEWEEEDFEDEDEDEDLEDWEDDEDDDDDDDEDDGGGWSAPSKRRR
jgi:hypothetical protein